MKTYIPGKDAALEDSINYFQQQLTKYDLEVKEASWLNPVPNVWSVHIQNINCPLCFANGKGSSKKAALASALGEYFERLSTNYFFSDFYLGKKAANADFVHYPSEKWFSIPEDNSLPKGLLSQKLLKFYDPDRELSATDLVDLQSSNDERGICTLPFEQQSDKQTVYVPVNLIANLYASNGMAAGNTHNEARVQAISEIFERYTKNKIIAEAISLPIIPTEVINRYPTVLAAIDALESEGFPLYCFDASLGGEFPVICVVLFNPQNGTCYASFGAHPNFGVALERTVTELLQGRSLKDLDVFSPPSFDNDDVADLSNLETHFIDSSGLISWDLFKEQADYEFVDWDFSGTTEQEFANLMAIFARHKTEVLIMDYEHLGVYACRILAVGMSEIYPPEDLLIANSNMAIGLRDLILSLPNKKHTAKQYLAIIEQLDDEGLDDYARVRELLGIATGNDNAWLTLRVGELKAMLALAGKDLTQAQQWIDWTLEMNESIFTPERNHAYRCLQTLVNFILQRGKKQFSSYQTAFDKMYGKACVDDMWQYANGEKVFFGLVSFAKDDKTTNNNLEQFAMHQKLLAVYNKLHQAML
ncbi:30S ribosomal protein S12 methylthiotransferase accessory protein YcaO [Gilliamella sp. Pra-s65]|uniref:30S ribosomal protein S12 methylthiotransferase accessory factor YcaO n=1 Tax=unclassified Gilliamella TaxID=2685620 RepID=UPI001321D395|nr:MULTISPECIES: 30S ribosomal protein S12 methylthiotransferase accessory factor YcaO [unclassified Gilliamella]MWN32664.1 30S ribosomal protein S12 methylthiotransferase accessory protein YcaO [Gilliamella sp. Pra-s60]MWN90520.1 30S ribosomal protein S12 methylthiotransferase accessory protein YcaO [Gilliamella sp. Pra-s65]MWP30113.1 30S ribosomal protein S12 methylthiotransferase accessory protein YcaO [Gilliamella sp. Pra-s54]MWP46084.1 30S ribosomal protein S12 methylthiotransferase access